MKTEFTNEELKELNSRPIDFSDIPETTPEQWKNGRHRNIPSASEFVVMFKPENYNWLKSVTEKSSVDINEGLNNAICWLREHNFEQVFN